MATSPSTCFSISSEHSLPTHFPVMDDAKHQVIRYPAPDSSAVPPSIYQKIIAELLGTYILIFAGCAAALVDREKTLSILGIAMVWGLTLLAMIYAVGHVSGAHFNPAVTIALAVAQQFPLIHVPVYVVAQFLGSILACLTLKVLFNDQGDILPTLTQYSSLTSDLEAIIWEFLITFALVFTICGVASDHRANNQLCGVAIGATVWFNVIIAGPITGASMNPARSIGPAVASGVYKNQWVYAVAPTLGAISASLIYSVLRQPKQEPHKEGTRGIYNNLYVHSHV